MGFGGDSDYEYFRIWLDKDVLNSSKTFDYGSTYEEGPLTEAADKFLKIATVEIWGFPDQ